MEAKKTFTIKDKKSQISLLYFRLNICNICEKVNILNSGFVAFDWSEESGRLEEPWFPGFPQALPQAVCTVLYARRVPTVVYPKIYTIVVEQPIHTIHLVS